jgi:hypothetical protein
MRTVSSSKPISEVLPFFPVRLVKFVVNLSSPGVSTTKKIELLTVHRHFLLK